MADGEPGFAYGASVLFPLFLRETGELVEAMLGGGSEGYRGCWYCWGGPPCCTAAEDMAFEGFWPMRTILTRGWYGVVGGVWLVQGETGSIQQYALESIMQGR